VNSSEEYNQLISEVIQKAEKAIKHLQKLCLKKPIFTEEKKKQIMRMGKKLKKFKLPKLH